MILTDKQNEGLKIILDRYKNKCKYTVISGYAGTGKSTLVRFAIEALKVDTSEVAYATYTGKAAEVLKQKGNDGACTLHHLLFEHIPLPNGKFRKIKKRQLGLKVVVVDEVSMVPQSLIDVLFEHPVYVIFLGDPFQLPQIDKEDANNLLDSPHIFLTEIMRQAAESEIIQLSMKIRNGERLTEFHGKEVQILRKHDLNTGMLTWADQILVATNSSRRTLNNQVRELLGYSGLPQEGERMICLKNYWDIVNSNGDTLVNGTTGVISNLYESYTPIPGWINLDSKNHHLETIVGDFKADGGEWFSEVDMDKKMITQEEKCVDWKVSYQLGKLKPRLGDLIPKEFSYAYALTYWKAQGSEWDKVLVIEEKFPFDKLEHARALYTACTRASKKLVLILNY